MTKLSREAELQCLGADILSSGLYWRIAIQTACAIMAETIRVEGLRRSIEMEIQLQDAEQAIYRKHFGAKP